MATNIHFEARRRQMVLDKACKARKEMALAQSSDGNAPSAQNATKPETIMCTDQGQFYQTREDEEQQNEEGTSRWRRPQKIRQKTPEPRPCPKTLMGVFTFGLVQSEIDEHMIKVGRDQFLEHLGVNFREK